MAHFNSFHLNKLLLLYPIRAYQFAGLWALRSDQGNNFGVNNVFYNILFIDSTITSRCDDNFDNIDGR